jgi:pyruvate dehydrogenase E1 component beta subunit
LLISAIRDDDPVIFVENKTLYNTKGPVPEESYTIPLGKAAIRREGKDLTIVALSRMVQVALEAASRLEERGWNAEVIDPRSVSPLDKSLLLESVKKTGRLIIVDEDNPCCGIASEIAALVSAEAFDFLKRPVQRITAPHAHVPFSPILEERYLPDARRVVDAAAQSMQ